MLSFTRTTVEGLVPMRHARNPGVMLHTPVTVNLLPGETYTMDLMSRVEIPAGHYGQLRFLKNSIKGAKIYLQEELYGK
jgi:hypothetical protein